MHLVPRSGIVQAILHAILEMEEVCVTDLSLRERLYERGSQTATRCKRSNSKVVNGMLEKREDILQVRREEMNENEPIDEVSKDLDVWQNTLTVQRDGQV
jgi:hypothetical protein